MSAIPVGRLELLLSMTTAAVNREHSNARKAIALTWPHRHCLRGRIVIRSNVQMIRDLPELRDDLNGC